MITWEKCKPEFENVTSEEVSAALEVIDRSNPICQEVARLFECHRTNILAQARQGLSRGMTLELPDPTNPVEHAAVSYCLSVIKEAVDISVICQTGTA